MLTPTYLDRLPDDIIELYTKLDEAVMRDIVRRLAGAGSMTSTAQWQILKAQESGLLYDELIQQIASISNASDAHVKTLLEDAGIESVKYDNRLYNAAGLSPPPLAMSAAAQRVLDAGIKKTCGNLRNLSMTTATQAQQSFIQIVTMAEMQIESGAFDYNTAIRNAIRQAGDAGAWVQYPTGYRTRLDVAVRQAVLTGAGQTSAKISETFADDMECDLVGTTAHLGARPDHAAWQGKVFSRSGQNKKYPPFSVTGYGTGPGLCGYNCRHSFFPFFEGLSESAYNRKELNDIENRKVEYNGEKMQFYDATQKERQMEREIRETKRRIIACDEAAKNGVEMSADFRRLSERLKGQQAKLKDFCEQTGLRKDNARVRVEGFGRSQAQRVRAARPPEPRQPKERSARKTSTKLTKPQPQEIESFSPNDIINKGGGKPLDFPVNQIAPRRADEQHIIKNEHETAILYGTNGRRIFAKEGNKDSVRFTSAQIKKMKDGFLTHNHPHSTTFSPADINMLRFADLSEIRAAGKDGVYVIRRPEQWDERINTAKKLNAEYMKLSDKIEPEIRKRYQAGEIDVEQFNQIYQHKVISEMSEEFGLDYKFERWDK